MSTEGILENPNLHTHTQNALSSKRRLPAPTEGDATAARIGHRCDVRTLEADMPAAARSVPLIWMLWRPSGADVNSRPGDARCVCPAVFTVVLCITCRPAEVPAGRCWSSAAAFTPTQFISLSWFSYHSSAYLHCGNLFIGLIGAVRPFVLLSLQCPPGL